MKDNNPFKEFKKKFPIIAREAFYFFSALILLGAVVEMIFPGLFSLFVNATLLVTGWIITLLLTIFYVRR